MKLLKLDEGLFSVHAICDDRGDAELLTFLEGLGANLHSNRDGMLKMLERCADHGPPRNSESKHHLGDGIYELIKGQLRVLYFTDKNRVIICSHGLVKKTGKVPKKDIAKATKGRRKYREARTDGQLEILEDDHG